MGNFDAVSVIDVLVKPGDTVDIDSPLLTLETDKATMDVPSTAKGVVEKVHVAKGGKVSPGSVVVTVKGHAASASEPAKPTSAATAPVAPAAPQAAQRAAPTLAAQQLPTRGVMPAIDETSWSCSVASVRSPG